MDYGDPPARLGRDEPRRGPFGGDPAGKAVGRAGVDEDQDERSIGQELPGCKPLLAQLDAWTGAIEPRGDRWIEHRLGAIRDRRRHLARIATDLPDLELREPRDVAVLYHLEAPCALKDAVAWSRLLRQAESALPDRRGAYARWMRRHVDHLGDLLWDRWIEERCHV